MHVCVYPAKIAYEMKRYTGMGIRCFTSARDCMYMRCARHTIAFSFSSRTMVAETCFIHACMHAMLVGVAQCPKLLRHTTTAYEPTPQLVVHVTEIMYGIVRMRAMSRQITVCLRPSSRMYSPTCRQTGCICLAYLSFQAHLPVMFGGRAPVALQPSLARWDGIGSGELHHSGAVWRCRRLRV